MSRITQFIDRMFGHRWAPFGAFVVLALAGAFLFQDQLSTIRSNQHMIKVAQHTSNLNVQRITTIEQSRTAATISNCQRLDAILASNNETGGAQYRFELTTIAYLSDVSKISKGKLRRGTEGVIGRLRNEAADATWTPLASCFSPSFSYQIPSPVHFSTRFPTKADLPATTTS
jgi:hypothetical protein